MKIEAGKYYRTRGGDDKPVTVVGPMQYSSTSKCWYVPGWSWTASGACYYGVESDMDLISEVYVSDTPPADTPAPETIRLDPRTEWKLFRQMGPHELVTNASVPMLETKTLRDEFAMAALRQAGDEFDNNPPSYAADWAYQYADAMMEARKK
jgi:hypothetical protein